jgi:hypothetical protein
MRNQLLSELYDCPGYSQKLSLNSDELLNLKSAINWQWKEKISKASEEGNKIIEERGINIEDYHLISDKINHAELWTKKSRILPQKFLKEFLESTFFLKLRDLFGDIIISDEENLGYGNIYWRLVRPKKNEDVGPLHRDSWFWQLNKDFPRPDYPFIRIKVWIAIATEVDKSGLLVERNSHKRSNINWEGKFKHGIMKPILLDDRKSFNMELVKTLPGESIIFNDELIHGGSINHGTKTRVSTEFTLLKRTS